MEPIRSRAVNERGLVPFTVGLASHATCYPLVMAFWRELYDVVNDGDGGYVNDGDGGYQCQSGCKMLVSS